MAGLDAHDIQDVTDQAQQVLCRMVGDFQRGAIDLPLMGTLDRQFEHADDRVHRGANLMADGRQEGTLGAVGIISQLLGLAQLLHQLAPLADVDPATDDALDFTE
ncbi:hypothetical protein D3C73_1224560 [compost metagenome]